MARRLIRSIVFAALAAIGFAAAAQVSEPPQPAPGAIAAPAQRPPPIQILIVDRERALSESAPARRLAETERRQRLELRAFLDALREELEAEEAEIAELRTASDPQIFEERVRAFDARVREARQTSQRQGEAMQARFAAARRSLSARLDPVLAELMIEKGASLILDRRNVLAAREGADVTDEVIARFNVAVGDELLLTPVPGRTTGD